MRPTLQPILLTLITPLALLCASAPAQRVELVTPESQAAPTRPAKDRDADTTHHVPVTSSAPETESDQPFELSRDPVMPQGYASGTGPVAPQFKADPYRLAFVGGEYRPASGERVDPALLRAWREAPASKTHTFGFVMFQGRITAARLQRVRDLGVRLDQFHTFQSFRARIPFDAIPALERSPDVRWIGYAKPWQKIDPELADIITARPAAAVVKMFVVAFESDLGAQSRKVPLREATPILDPNSVELPVFGTQTDGPMQRALEAHGAGEPQWFEEVHSFAVEAPLDAVEDIVALDFVHFVEPDRAVATTHDRTMRMIGVDMTRTMTQTDGSRAGIGILDTGVWFAHADIGTTKHNLNWNFSTASGTGLNDTSGHGTHVMGTIVGQGLADQRYMGCVPAAGRDSQMPLYIGKILPGGTAEAMGGIITFQTSQNGTTYPHVVNNSWRIGDGGAYIGTSLISKVVDDASYLRGQVHVVAAGNEGGSPGAERTFRITRPADAKNAFAVGSVHDSPFGDSTRNANWDTSTFTHAGLWATGGREEVFKITTNTDSTPMVISGLQLWTRANRTRTITVALYRADSSGNLPTGNAIRTGTMTIGTALNFHTGELSSPYTVAPGQTVFLGYKAPLMSNSIMRSTVTSGSNFPYARRLGTGSWAAFSARVAYAAVHRPMPGHPVAQSSVGPTGDFRVKPNIVAPGRYITSCQTRTVDDYTAKQGTSMAAPHVSGVVASVVDKDPATFAYRPPLIKALIAATSRAFDGRDRHSMTRTDPDYIYRMGLGLVDAYRANWSRNSSAGWVTGHTAGTLNALNSGAAITIDVPSDAESLTVALTWDEPAASIGALRAAAADLDLWVDVEPFTGGYFTGEFSSRRSWDTWEWVYLTDMTSLRGKRVRLKINPRVRPLAFIAKYGLAYCIDRGRTRPATRLTVTGPDPVRPRASFLFKARADVPENVALNTHIELDDPTAAGFTILSLRQDLPNMTLYRRNSNLRWPDLGLLEWTLGNTQYWYTSNHRELAWSIQAPNVDGTTSMCVTVNATNNGTAITRHCRTVCVDGQVPQPITGMTSFTHTPNVWSNRQLLTVRWNQAQDAGCAGISALAYSVDSSLSTPGNFNLPPTATSQSVLMSSSRLGQYFQLRARDEAGNFGAVARSGRYYVDVDDPTIATFALAGGARYTRSLTVTASLSASDVHSGLFHVQHSLDGSTWSPWQTYASSFSINLSSYGGGTRQGLRTARVRVRDRAGNVSDLASDSITYDSVPPNLSSVVLARGNGYTRTLSVSLDVTATGQPTEMRYSMDGVASSPWLPYVSTRSIDLSSYGGSTRQGTKTVYVHLRDAAGNRSTTVSDSIVYDSIAPVISSVALNGGASHTSSLNVTVQTVATGSPHQMRYSMNGTTWAPWRSFAASLAVDLSSYGGTTATGTKTIRVQVRDRALNLSNTASDSITYLPQPVLSSATPSRLAVVNRSPIRLSGTGLASVTRVDFGSHRLTVGTSDDWLGGYFVRVSDTAIDLFTPQGLTPNSYPTVARNAAFASNSLAISLARNATRFCGAPTRLRRGGTLDILVARGDMPATTLSYLTLSASGLPLTVPGLVSLAHGGHPTLLMDPTFIVVSAPQLHDPGSGAARWTIPNVLVLGRIYFQAIMVDPANPGRLPIPVSLATSVSFY